MAFQRYFQARLKGRIHGSETINVYNFGTNEAAADNDALAALLAQLAVAIIQCAVAQLPGATSSDWELTGVDCRQLHPTITDPVEVGPENVTSGLRQPVNTSFEAVLVRIRTGGGGKRGRGRNFLPPPGDADMTNSLLVAGSATDFYKGFIDCLVGKFIGNAKSTPFALGVLSRKHLKDTPGDYDGAFRPGTELILETKVSCLRSRKLGHGS